MRGGREAVAVSATESGLRPVSSAGWPWTSSGPLKASLRVLGRIRDGSQSVQAHRGGGPDLEILGNLPPTAALLAPSHHLIAAHATLRAPACFGAIHVVRHEYVLNNVGQAGQAGQCVETDDIAGLDKSASSAESVGRFWFRESSQVVIKGNFHSLVGTKAVGSSGNHSDFVVETLNGAIGDFSFGSKPIQDQRLMGA